ncbi:MAG TPA: hypothetical protein VFP76_01115, partial [Gemmatimonadota bacterium]|nr:hypothetical protein [Gemmatimonadota bacterium]
MILDEETLRALEWSAVLDQVARHTNAGHAAEGVRACRPFERIEDAREALAEVGEGMALLDERAAFPAPYVVDHARTLRLLSAPGATLEGPALVSA